MMGRLRVGAGDEKKGGGMTSEAVGSWKVRFSSAFL